MSASKICEQDSCVSSVRCGSDKTGVASASVHIHNLPTPAGEET
jgi:hypothetical protein